MDRAGRRGRVRQVRDAETELDVADPRRCEQLFGLLRIVRVDVAQVLVPRLPDGNHGADEFSLAAPSRVDDRLTVDGVVDGLADLGNLEEFILVVVAEHDLTVGVAFEHLVLRLVRELADLLRHGEVGDDVELPGTHRRVHGVRVGVVVEVHDVEVRLGAPVVLVAFEGDLRTGFPSSKLVRA